MASPRVVLFYRYSLPFKMFPLHVITLDVWMLASVGKVFSPDSMTECEWGEDFIQWRQLCWKGLVAFIYCRIVSIISSSSEWFHRPFFVTMTGPRLSRLQWDCLIYHVQYPQIWRASSHRKVSSSFLSYFFKNMLYSMSFISYLSRCCSF